MLATWLLAVAAQVETPSREERVLELLRALEQEHGSFHYGRARFERRARAGERPLLLPSYFLLCATCEGAIDDGRFRRLGLDLLRAFGLMPGLDVEFAAGTGMARIDGLDLRQKIGFELRGQGDPKTRAARKEDAAEALSDAEQALFETAGLRLFVVDRRRYRDDGDGFTPALAFAAELVSFLNEVTEGEDVELGGLLFEQEAAWVWDLVGFDGMRLRDDGLGPELLIERPSVARIAGRGFRFVADGGEALREPRPGTPEMPPSSARAPSAVVIPCTSRSLEPGCAGPEVRVRYRQRAGAIELVHEARSFVAFLPSAFDLTQPFELELELAPGLHTFHGTAVRVGSPTPRH